MEHRNLDPGLVLELGCLVSITFFIVECIRAAMVCCGDASAPEYEVGSTAAQVDEVNTDQQCSAV